MVSFPAHPSSPSYLFGMSPTVSNESEGIKPDHLISTTVQGAFLLFFYKVQACGLVVGACSWLRIIPPWSSLLLIASTACSDAPRPSNKLTQSQEGCQCDSRRCEHRIKVARHDVAQALLRDSLQDVNDERNRFIPLSHLRSEFDSEKIQKLARTFFDDKNLDFSKIADQISPKKELCPCYEGDDSRHCTGRRIIFISLILLAKEKLIFDFIELNPSVCDTMLMLPLRSAMAQASRLGEEMDKDQIQAALAFVEIEGLMQIEKDLFYHLQWQLRSPYFTGRLLSSDDFQLGEVSLPWTKVTNLEKGNLFDMQFSTLYEIKIHQDHHNLVRSVRHT